MSYTGGAITLLNGGTTFTLDSGDLYQNIDVGWYLEIDGVIGTVKSITSTLEGELEQPWAGADQSDGEDYIFSATTPVLEYQYRIDLAVQADSDPSTGFVRPNNTDLTAVTYLYFNTSDRFTQDMTAWLASLDDSDSDTKGRLKFVQTDDILTWVEYEITGDVVTASGYRKVPVSYVVKGSGTFTDEANVIVKFNQRGNRGTDGTDGTDGQDGAPGADGNDGAPGVDGDDGADGVTAGLRMIFNTITTDSDPGNGRLSYNQETVPDVTIIYIDTLDAFSGSIGGLIESWDNSSSAERGRLRIVKANDQSIWAEFRITDDIVPAGNYYKIPVAVVDEVGTFDVDDDIVIAFARTGDKGTAGTNGTNGIDGEDGTDGVDGDDGADGVTPAMQLLWSTDIDDSDPTAGYVKVNNSTYASATFLFIDVLDRFNGTITGFIDSWDDSTSETIKGSLRITSTSDPGIWIEFAITGLVDVSLTEYRRVPVLFKAGNGVFTAGDIVAVTFSAKGDKGEPGTDGIDGEDGTSFDNTSLAGTSTSTLTVELGSKTFVTQENKSWSVGQRLRAANDDGTLAMEGTLISYSGTSLNMYIDKIVGTGSHSDWNISFTGSPGLAGADGTDGFQSGTKLYYSDTTIDEDPGSGEFRFSDTDVEIVDKLWISIVDAVGGDIITWLTRMGESTTSPDRGSIRIEAFQNPDAYAVFQVTGGVTDKEGYYEIPVAYLAAGGAFADGDLLIFNFIRTGNAGADGEGAGDVLGPDGGVVDGHVAVWDTTTGKLLKTGGAPPLLTTNRDNNTALGSSTTSVPTQNAVKTYSDKVATEAREQGRVKAATTGNVTIATDLNAGDTIDGVTLTGDSEEYVLLWKQTDPKENGVYKTGAVPARAPFFDTFAKLVGALIVVANGTANGGKLIQCISEYGGTLGSTDVEFIELTTGGTLLAANNLSDLDNLATARQNLGVEIGADVQAWSDELDALAAFADSAGIIVKTGNAAYAARTLTGPAAGLTITNGSGAAGNPTIALANMLAAIESFASTGLLAVTTTDTVAGRTIQGTTNQIDVANGSGVGGNPVISFPASVSLYYSSVLVRDSTFAVCDDADSSKYFIFQCTFITSGAPKILRVQDATGTIALLENIDDHLPVGTVVAYLGTSEPNANWLFLYGQNISRTTYADLFGVVGTTYGVGNGSTTFGLPDLRGRVIAGQDDMGGTSANRLTGAVTGGLNGDVLGATGGEQSHTLVAFEVPNIGLNVAYTVMNGGTAANPGAQLGSNIHNSLFATNSGTGYTIHSFNGNTTGGGGGAHNVLQPTIILNYMVKALAAS